VSTSSTNQLSHDPRLQHLLPLSSHHSIQDATNLLAAIDRDSQHALHSTHRHSGLHDQRNHLVRSAERSSREERQLLLLGPIQIQQRIRRLAFGRIRRGRAGRARNNEVGRGNASINECESRGIQASSQQSAVLREDLERDGNGAAGVEMGEDGGCKCRGNSVLKFERPSRQRQSYSG
jgi:hypothetical protein